MYNIINTIEVLWLDYIITFFQGLISFVSPCMIPMLPIYISYFAGNRNKKSSTLMRALFFVLGFTFVFSVLGMFAGALGSFFVHYETQLHMVCGAIIVLLGLNFMGVIKIPFIKGLHAEQEVTGIFTSFLFGIVFSMSHIPCIMAFLGSALTLAAHAGTACKGILLLVVYSLGMGIPFLVSALIIDKLSNLLDIVRKNHKKIDLISGILLIVLGVLMMTGILHHLMGHTHVH